MAVIACKLIVEHKLLDMNSPKPPPPSVDFSDIFSDLSSINDMLAAATRRAREEQVAAEVRARRTAQSTTKEVPRRVLLSQPVKCQLCRTMILPGSYSCWSKIGAVYHTPCWDLYQASKETP